jgi:hypothetical protein
MTDQELQRRVNRDHDYRTIRDRVVLILIVMVGILVLAEYLMTTTWGVRHGSSGEICNG